MARPATATVFNVQRTNGALRVDNERFGDVCSMVMVAGVMAFRVYPHSIFGTRTPTTPYRALMMTTLCLLLSEYQPAAFDERDDRNTINRA